MPFAGELMQVRDEERDWEGAAERAVAQLRPVAAGARYALQGAWPTGWTVHTCEVVWCISMCVAQGRRVCLICTVIRWYAS